MAELPKSWNLRTRKGAKGKVEVWGKDDHGKDYKVRACDHDALTERDVAEIASVDRERTTAREFVSNLVAKGRRERDASDAALWDDLTEAAGPVVHAGLERSGSSVGYTRAFARNYDSAFKEN